MLPDPPPPLPSLPASTAYTLLILYALGYFVPFYLSRTTRPSFTLSRDAPSVIRARIRSVTLSCLVCSVVTFFVLLRAGNGDGNSNGGKVVSGKDALHLMGLWPVGVWETVRAVGLTAVLFAGPLYSYLLVDRGWKDWARLAPVTEVWGEWTTFRNIVAGPITEEILFRTASIPLALLSPPSTSPPSPTKIILLTPILFGLAHVHHFYEFRLTHPHVPIAHALIRSAFQFAYTTLFGAYATFLFLRTGSLVAVCAVHAFCNCMGLPQVWGRVEPEVIYEEEQEEGPVTGAGVPVLAGGDASGGGGDGGNTGEGYGATDTGTGPGTGRTFSRVRSRPSILWTVAYYTLLVGGAVGWYRNLWTLSESGNALVPSSAF
ncbi:hypothetical protein B0J18DRAFT_195165 [Chaetomium sp. MPI-SDFR-AT-0129]|nr:hypothetical protein B0J18DRAFT_195165 [Chaetomium sp. MPI-SDFR-AT-0129]